MARRGASNPSSNLLIVGDSTSGTVPSAVRAKPVVSAPAPETAPAQNSPQTAVRQNAEREDLRSFGRRLRDARQLRGFSTSDVSRALKFTTSQIEALEADDLQCMEPVYATGFVRCYAQLLGEKALGASVAEAVEAFQHEKGFVPSSGTAKPARAPRRVLRLPRLPGFSLVIAAALMSIAVYASWHFFKEPVATAKPVAGQSAYQGAVADIAVYRADR